MDALTKQLADALRSRIYRNGGLTTWEEMDALAAYDAAKDAPAAQPNLQPLYDLVTLFSNPKHHELWHDNTHPSWIFTACAGHLKKALEELQSAGAVKP